MSIRETAKSIELGLKKAAPDIMFVAGIALSAASIFEFCKKSKKGSAIIDQCKDNLDEIIEDHDLGDSTDKEYRHDILVETGKTAKELVKVYWVPATMWGVSTALITGSHCILKERNAALTVIATGLGAELRTLHKRIIDRFGEEVDQELKFGTETKEIETTSVDKETGEEIKNKAIVPVSNGCGGFSLFARYFDDGCAEWKNDAEYNLAFLKAREAEANQRLKANGYLYLNEVYDMLGMKRSRAGQKVGWQKNSPLGDGYVSFGIYNIYRQGNRDFVNGYQPTVLLDFNVDGEILDSMPDFDEFGNPIW